MKQRKLKKGGLITLIASLSMIPPLATDLYLPALPEIVTFFDTTTSMASLTMTIFFIFMAFGTLVLGPLSDRYGRKVILTWSTALTLICSVVCAFSPTITFLIGARAVQAFCAGGMIAMGSALVKDCFAGPEMGKVLSITQAMVFIAPVVAPILGALILQFYDWSMTFIALGALLGITLVLALLLDETLPEEQRVQESTLQSISGLATVVKNPVFTFILLVGGVISAPFMAYIGVASYVYVNRFHTTETMFSIYFAVTSAFMVFGTSLYARFGQRPYKKVLGVCFSVAVIAGILLLTIGETSPMLFLISYIPFAIMTTYIRPYTAELLLNAQKENIGAASAAMNFGFTILGSSGMFIGSLRWPSYVSGIAYTIFIFTALAMAIFIAANRLKVFKNVGPEH